MLQEISEGLVNIMATLNVLPALYIQTQFRGKNSATRKEKAEERKEEAHRENQAQTLVRNENWSDCDVIKHTSLTLY
jgi:cell division protein ZapA (FtsZ GTPase activity inhibitor)